MVSPRAECRLNTRNVRDVRISRGLSWQFGARIDPGQLWSWQSAFSTVPLRTLDWKPAFDYLPYAQTVEQLSFCCELRAQLPLPSSIILLL